MTGRKTDKRTNQQTIMNVLYITTAFPRHVNDSITPWLVKTIQLLKKKEINIDVFTSAYKGLTYNKINNIDVFRFRYFLSSFERLTHEEMTLERMKKGLFYKILPIFYIIFGVKGIFFHCRRKKYDIIHVHWPFPHFIFGYIASRMTGAPIVSSFHGVELRFVKNSSLNLRPFLKWVVKKSGIITVNSTHTAMELKTYNPKNLKIIPFGAAVEPKGKVKYKNSQGGYRILFVGRLVERKGVEYLLEAINLLKERKINEIQLIVVGEGNRKNYLIEKKNKLELSDKNVIFIGRVSKEELIKQYQLCDIFVLPAIIDSAGDTEGLGVVLLEAMSFKKPIIASRVGGIVDIIKDKETGLLVEEKMPEELATAIEFLINNTEKRQVLAENGYRFQKKYFSWDRIISSILSSYKGVIHGKREKN